MTPNILVLSVQPTEMHLLQGTLLSDFRSKTHLNSYFAIKKKFKTDDYLFFVRYYNLILKHEHLCDATLL